MLKLATNFNLKYTRYADDITFSGYYNAFEASSDFIQNMKRIIMEEGFFLNEKKTRLQKHNIRQEVTGLIVSPDRVNVTKKYIKDLRGILFCWEKYGKEEVLNRFIPKYTAEKNIDNLEKDKEEAKLKKVLLGRLSYLRMVKGADNSTYQKLQERFNKLCGINPNQKIEDILTLWEKQGIDAAMKKYYKKDSDKETVEVFIGTLMDRKPLPRDIKERIIALCAIDLQKNLVKEDAAARSSYPEPKQTYEFLSFFSQNDGGLKNLTHDFNYGYIEYDAFIAKCREEFEEGKKRFPKVPIRLLGRIDAFAFRETPDWYIRKGAEKKIIKYGWSSPDFIEWYKTNRIHPSKDAFYNKEMIAPFKESIQVRADTGNLVLLLHSLVEIVFGKNPSCNIIISERVKDAQFYTDVDSLGQALYQIFTTIKEYSEKNFCGEVEIDYSTEGEFKVLTVTHIDSKPTKRADDKDYLGGNTDAIKTQLMGLCNYEICAAFPDGNYRKLILFDHDDYKKYQKDKKAKIVVSEKGERNEITILVPLDLKLIKGYTHKMLFY